MSRYEIEMTSRFRRDFRAAEKRGRDVQKLREIIQSLAEGTTLPEKNRDHALTGGWMGYRECHIQPDWLLIYKIKKDVLILVLARTGSHSDLFA